MQCIVVKSGEFENSYSLLYILLKSCLCCCSLATLAPQQQVIVIYLTSHSFFFSLKHIQPLGFLSNFRKANILEKTK